MPYTASRVAAEAEYNTVDTLAVRNGRHPYPGESACDIPYKNIHCTFNGYYVRLLLQHKRRCSQ
jgi:hypothetical protein